MRLWTSIRALATAAGAAWLAAAAVPAHAVEPNNELNVVGLLRAFDQWNWDTTAWFWKTNPDAFGMESMGRGNLKKGPRGSNEYGFNAGDFVPYQFVEGALAESWEVKQNPLRIQFNLRKGVNWQEIPGVMKARPLVAADVINNFKVMKAAPKNIKGFWEYVDRWEAPDDHTVVAYLSRWQADWDYQLLWGYYNGIQPPERLALSNEQRAQWQTIAGTGPYRLANWRAGQPVVYERNPGYWDSVTLDGKSYKLPLNSKVIVHNLADVTAAIAALTTGRADLWQGIPPNSVPDVKRAAPDLKWHEYVAATGTQIALPVNRKPFDDVRVRRALNVAIDGNALLKGALDGKGVLLNFPFSATWSGLATPIEQLAPAAREMFAYNPQRARELLKEAGYPNGFEFDLIYPQANSVHADMVPMLQAFYKQVGVTMNAKPMEQAAYDAQRRNAERTAAYLYDTSHGTPVAVLRKSFQRDQPWNPMFYASDEFDKRFKDLLTEMNPETARTKSQALNRWIIEEEVPYVFLPSGRGYTAWWPWVKNFHGETSTGAWDPAFIYANIWIDNAEKQRMLSGRR
ncbi:MAG: ABC transporter substrate-binding protein [Burkholderiaceae bacterium]|nr:ABC transporter substrate-binding protein [Burkholderiaceae bacterium]